MPEASSSSSKAGWRPEEDVHLCAILEALGGPKKEPGFSWTEVARTLGGGRNGKSCRLRWKNQLRPDLKKGPFTADEDAVILQAHTELGSRWASVAKRLPGRTDNMIKNRWNSTLKRRAKETAGQPAKRVHRAPAPVRPASAARPAVKRELAAPQPEQSAPSVASWGGCVSRLDAAGGRGCGPPASLPGSPRGSASASRAALGGALGGAPGGSVCSGPAAAAAAAAAAPGDGARAAFPDVLWAVERVARFSSPPGLEPGAAGLLSAARGLGAPAAASPPPASAQTCGRPDWALQAGLGVALRAAAPLAPAPACASAASAPAGGWAGEPGWAAAVAAVRAGGRRARAQALAEAHSGVYPAPPALGAPLESYSLADMQRAFGLGRAAEHSDRRSSCGSPSPVAVAAVQCRGAPGDPDAAFAALTAGGPRQTLPCAAASPFYALLGKAALPPEPELSAAGAWGADGRLCAGRAHGGLWAGPAPGADPAGCPGDLGLGLRLDPDAPAAEVLAGCASFQAHVLARPAAFCETGMPSTGSTESDGTFVGPALGLAGLPGYDLAPVHSTSAAGCYARFAGALRPAPACERALPGQHWLPGEPEFDFTSLH